MTENDERFDSLDARLREVERSIDANTDLTKEIRDVIVATKLGLRVLGGLGVAVKWAGMIAAGGLSIYAAIYAITHGGMPPE